MSSLPCPYCRRTVMPDHRGRCPFCAVELPGHAGPAAAAPAADAENPYAAPRAEVLVLPGQDLAPGLRRAGLGVSLVYYALVLVLLAVIGVMALGFLNAWMFARQPHGARLFALLPGIVGLAALASFVMDLAGRATCMAVPAQSGARGLAAASLALQLFGAGAPMVAPLVPLPAMAGPATVLATLAALGASGVLFLLFLRRTARFIHRDDLARRAGSVLVAAVILVALALAVALLQAGPRPLAGEAAGVIVGLVMFIGGLATFVMYANLLNSLRGALRRTS